MYNNKRRVAKKKQKYPIDKKKLTAFSDLLHPSERFGAKIDKLNEERGLDYLNEDITRGRLTAGQGGYGDDDMQVQEYGNRSVGLKGGEVAALDLFNTPHNYVRMSLPVSNGRRGLKKPRAIKAGGARTKKSGYRRKF